ncbi:hypothetical protein NS220_16605 [Microbacterium testaceum]|uniref:Uncharacterized protein n=1 Tax=Microbacterium testaceum TaxID=2033 RepID=A0A147ET52_MICTE|nr:hypothetical protein [Microbacterium testaceum]KTR88087.1 hypothetical protein NS220_16605 [Microbacterium testaceum]
MTIVSTTVRRRPDVLGTVAVIIAIAALLPLPALLVAGLVPALSGIGWYGLLVLPIAALVAAIALLLAIIGIVVGSRAGSPIVTSVVAVLIALFAIAPGVFVWVLWGH